MTNRHMHDTDRLCRYAGILAEYRSVTGETVALDRESRFNLLRAMGIEAETAREAEESVIRIESEIWGRTLDPVQVARVDEQPLRIHARLPENYLRTRWALQVIEESGRIHHGFVEPFPLRYRRIKGEMRALCEIPLDFVCQTGYHRLELRGEFNPDEAHAMSLIVCPVTAFVHDRKRSALTLQTYALFSRDDSFTGIGTLRETRELARRFPEFLPGLSPVHALFYSQPDRRSPYSPSSRYWFNHLLLDLAAIPEWQTCPEARDLAASPDFERERAEVCQGDAIPYARVAALRASLLEPLFNSFYNNHFGRGTIRDLAFARFCREGGTTLARHALFEALSDFFSKQGLSGSVHWPAGYESPAASGTREFAGENQERLLFFQYLQWNCRRQLRGLERELNSNDSGLYLDLAVGAAPDGSEVWSNPGAYANAFIGAPPDAFSPSGQNWGLAPFHPLELRLQAYEPFIRLLRANMPPRGILRIDHVMGLARLYWTGPNGGGYVRYPFNDLAGILALESRRRRCEVIGEDLGTVPVDMRDTLRDRRIFSFRVMYFEKDESGFFSPDHYPEFAAAALNTHDLPTLRGYLTGRDIDVRAGLGLLDEKAAATERLTRQADVRALLRLAGFFDADPAEIDANELTDRLHRLLKNAPPRLKLFSLHDLLEETEQPNLPGTVDEYHNWALRYSRPVEEIDGAERLKRL